MSQELTFNELPGAVAALIDKVDELKELILSRKEEATAVIKDKLFDLGQLIGYLPEHPAKSTVYGWVCDNLILYSKTGKRLRFKKSEIDVWLSQNAHKTDADLQVDALNLAMERKGGLR